MDYYKAEHVGRFTGIDGHTYRLVSFKRGSVAKFELYLVEGSGLELFVGYVTRAQAERIFSCERCGADPFQRCWATGAVTPQGTPMQSNHAHRKQALSVVC